jgi:group I intron endonuclease
MKIAGVYMIQSISKPERIYVGSSMGVIGRKWQHFDDLKKNRHHSLQLQNHYNKYGKDDLEFSMLESGEYFNNTHLLAREQGWFMPYSFNGAEKPYFNIVPVAGSCLGVEKSEETRRKLKENSGRRGKPAWNSGRVGVYSEETLNSMREAAKDRTFSDITRQRISDSHINVSLSEDHVKQIVLGLTGKPKSVEHVKNNVEAHKKPILQYDLNMNFIKEWDFTSTASRELCINFSAISKCLTGVSNSSGGFIWKYKFNKKIA